MASAEKDKHAETIIRNHVLWSMASGAIPVAFADLAAVSAVQLDMIRQLCEVYDVDFSVTKGKAMVTAITSAAIARVGAASLVKLVPIAGTLVGSVTGGVFAGASSYGLGQAFKTHLSSGGTFLDVDVDRLKRMYREQFEKGKEVVKNWQEEASEFAEEQTSKSRFKFDELIRRERPDGPTAKTPSAEPAPADPAPADTSHELVEDPAAPSPDAPAAASPNSLSDKLKELSKLHERGLISDADYESTKARLLAAM